MGINDLIRIKYREEYKDYIPIQGGEPFIDYEGLPYEFETYEEVAEWIYQNFPPNAIDLRDPTPKNIKDGQLTLF